MWCFEQILEAAPHKIEAVWSLTSHNTNQKRHGGKARTKSCGKFSNGILNIDKSVLVNQQKLQLTISEYEMLSRGPPIVDRDRC